MSDENDAPVARELSSDRCLQISRICCGLVIAIGLSVLVGWTLDSTVLKSILPGAVAMKPNTAIALCLGALSLLLFTGCGGLACDLKRKLSITFAVAMGTIGALTLIQYLAGVNLGIDELFFRDHARSAAPGYHPGRMSPISAFNFLVFALAFTLIHRSKTTVWAQAITACAAFTSVLAIVGYFFGVEALYRSGNFTAVALNTATAFIALCTGLWCATHDFGFMRLVTGAGISGIVVRRFGLPALMLSLAISWVHLQGEHLSWFEPDFGEAFFAMINLVTLGLLVWVGAVSLQKAEVKEAVIQERLRCAHLELEDRVHERTRALEKALYLNEQIMDNSLDVICIIDAEGRFTTVSGACEKLWGYTPAELLGRPFIELVHPDDHVRSLEAAGRILEGHDLRDFENRYLRKDGSLIAMTWSVSWSATAQSMFCVARDATEQRRAEAALQQARDDADRGQSRQERVPRQHEPRDSHADEWHPRHDRAHARHAARSDEQREYLEMVKTSAHALLGVINDILDFSKIEAGKLELEAISFSLRETIGAIAETARRARGSQGPGTRRRHPGAACRTISSATRCACGRSWSIWSTTRSSSPSAARSCSRWQLSPRTRNARSCISPSPTPASVSRPRNRQQFSKRSRRWTVRPRRQYGGTGLGLAIATRLVQQMHGRIWVESRLGHGTTFHFTISLATSPVPMTVVKPLDFAQLDGLRVLIVDDNALNCRILHEMARNWRMEPVAVRSASAALETMRSAAEAGEPFPLVLLDAMMPEMDGFALAESIKTEPRLAGATVMMLSSAMRSGQTGRAAALGIQSILTKPVMPSELLDAILFALRHTALAAKQPVRDGGRSRPLREARSRFWWWKITPLILP